MAGVGTSTSPLSGARASINTTPGMMLASRQREFGAPIRIFNSAILFLLAFADCRSRYISMSRVLDEALRTLEEGRHSLPT